MRTGKNIILAALVLISFYGCNIVPKSVQYQREEEKLIGSTDIINPKIEEVQVILKSEGYEPGNTDGRMGKETRDAIKAFQESIGLKSTGYIDKTTLTQLEDSRRAKEILESKKDYALKAKESKGKAGANKAEFKPAGKDIQTALKNAGFDPGKIDGKMGPRTRQAIKDFQKSKGLVPDGVVGPKTWNLLGKHL
ncbi:MAG: peptidoglycan-binding protein [Candidatus Omnitrophota bacterium]|nr:peptidoglycan-binding protein [Candidatus Omnitrophota bacterium]